MQKGFIVKIDKPILLSNRNEISEVLLLPRHQGYPILKPTSYPVFVNIFISKNNYTEKNVKELDFILTGILYDEYDEAKRIEDALSKLK